MKKARRFTPFLSLLFVLLFALSMMTACGDSGDVSEPEDSGVPNISASTTDSAGDATTTGVAGDGTTTEGAADGTTTGTNAQAGTTTGKKPTGNQTTTTANKVLGNDNKTDMKGYVFSIASTFLPNELGKNATLFEELFFERKAQVEKEYNCKINIINMYPDMATLKPYITAGKKIADLVELGPAQIIAAAELGYIQPWNNVGPIDVKDARWPEPSDTLGVYEGKTYGLSFYRPPEVRYCVIFNKTLLKSYNINPDSLYEAVDKKTWNFDMMRNLAIQCTKDNDGDGTMDTYGIIGPPSYIGYGLLKANNASLATKTNGKISVSINSQAAKNALNYYYDLVNKDKVVYTANAALGKQDSYNKVNELKWIREFLNGKAAFMLYESWVINQQVKPGAGNMEYGMLPYPMGPDAKNYITSADNSRLLCLTSTNKEKEKTATIFNALAYPVDGEDGLDYWYDIQADYFQNNDKRSLDMYKLCLQTSVTDIGAASGDLFYGFFSSAVAETVYAHMATPNEKLDSMIGMYDNALQAIFKK